MAADMAAGFVPCTATMSQPASAAAWASSSDPTCQQASAPPRWASSTSTRSGSAQKKSMIRTRAAAASTASRSTSSVRKFAASTPVVREAMSPRILSRLAAVSPSAVMLPTPPASATATASAGVETDPIGACCSGTRQPTSSVKRVVTAMIMTLHRDVQAVISQPSGIRPDRPSLAAKRRSISHNSASDGDSRRVGTPAPKR